MAATPYKIYLVFENEAVEKKKKVVATVKLAVSKTVISPTSFFST